MRSCSIELRTDVLPSGFISILLITFLLDGNPEELTRSVHPTDAELRRRSRFRRLTERLQQYQLGRNDTLLQRPQPFVSCREIRRDNYLRESALMASRLRYRAPACAQFLRPQRVAGVGCGHRRDLGSAPSR